MLSMNLMEGSIQISIRTSHDLSEIWNNVCQGKKVVLWCDGLRELDSSSRREKRSFESDDSAGGLLQTKAIKRVNMYKNKNKAKWKK